MSDVLDRWAAGTTYEEFMGRWSRRIAFRFVSWLGLPGGLHWLDVGCGTGALTEAICRHTDPASVLGCDPAAPFVEYARQHTQDSRASFVVAEAGDLPVREDGYDSISSLLALNFFPDPRATVEEMRSLSASQGAVSACVWDYADKMEFLRYFWDTVISEDPSARELDEGVRFPICGPESLEELFGAAGLGNVQCEPIEIVTEFIDFDDYWRPLLGGTGPAPSYVESLEPDRRTSLARKLEAALPRGPGGRVSLVARAWAVRGTVT